MRQARCVAMPELAEVAAAMLVSNGAPTDGSAWEGGGSAYHTLRGGGWDLPAFFLHAALRGPYGEIHRRGFRVAADRR